MEQHHTWGFSKWPALIVCPHYESSDKESQSAKTGTENHVDFSEYINEINTGVPALHENENARWAARAVSVIAEGAEIHSETRVMVPELSIPASGVFGTCDAWFISNGFLHVIDYKSGARSSIDYTPQVMGYAYALAIEHPEVKDKTICGYVLYGASREMVSIHFSFKDAMEIATKVAENFSSKDTKEPCANGYCQYCKHNKECKAMAGNMIAFKNNELTNMSDAALYDWLVSAKAAVEKWLADLKEIAKNNGGVLTDGNIRYELKTDKRGKMTSVDVAQLWYDMSDRGCSVTQEQLMKACTISKKAFTDLYKAEAKAHGMLVKDIESTYTDRCTFGEPATKLVKVEAK